MNKKLLLLPVPLLVAGLLLSGCNNKKNNQPSNPATVISEVPSPSPSLIVVPSASPSVSVSVSPSPVETPSKKHKHHTTEPTDFTSCPPDATHCE